MDFYCGFQWSLADHYDVEIEAAPLHTFVSPLLCKCGRNRSWVYLFYVFPASQTPGNQHSILYTFMSTKCLSDETTGVVFKGSSWQSVLFAQSVMFEEIFLMVVLNPGPAAASSKPVLLQHDVGSGPSLADPASTPARPPAILPVLRKLLCLSSCSRQLILHSKSDPPSPFLDLTPSLNPAVSLVIPQRQSNMTLSEIIFIQRVINRVMRYE